MDLTDFQASKDWVKVWSGRWSLYTDSHFGIQWTVENIISGKPAFKKVIYVYKDGISDCWVSEAEKSDLGNRLASLVRKNSHYPEEMAQNLKAEAGRINEFIATHNPVDVAEKELKEFWDIVRDYYAAHLRVKYIVDYLSPEELERFLPVLEEARLYAEPVFRNTENFVEAVAKVLALKTGYSAENILSILDEELGIYFSSGNLPDKAQLEERYRASAIIFYKGTSQLFAGDELKKIETILFAREHSSSIRGQTGYKGTARGTVRIVWSPDEAADFKEGDILVTGMTRPEFLPLMKKAAAFVTDAGGILSHAAIVAREMKKPCIIGTQVATKVLKDGDMVEVDADQGAVRIVD